MDESDQISEDWLMVPNPLNLIEQTDSSDPYEVSSNEVYDTVDRIDYPDVFQNCDQDIIIPLKDELDFYVTKCKWIDLDSNLDCDLKFGSEDLLIEHYRRDHLQINESTQKDENSSVCQRKDCSGEKEPYNIVHMKNHSGEKPHKCSTSNRILVNSEEDENNSDENYSDRPQLKKSAQEICSETRLISEEIRSVAKTLAELTSETFSAHVANEIPQSTCSTKEELSKKRNPKKDINKEKIYRISFLLFCIIWQIFMMLAFDVFAKMHLRDLNTIAELRQENVQLKDRLNQMQKDNSKLNFSLRQISKKLERQEYMSEMKILSILKYHTILEKNKKTDAIKTQQGLPAKKVKVHQVEEEINTEQGLPAKKVSAHQVEGMIANRIHVQEIIVNHENFSTNLTLVMDHVKKFHELLTLFRDKLSSKRSKLPEKVSKPNPCLYFKSEKPLPSLGKKPKSLFTVLDDLKEAGYKSYKFIKTALECWVYKVEEISHLAESKNIPIMDVLEEFRKELEKISDSSLKPDVEKK